MQATQPRPFGKLRNFLWPIHGYEHKKLLPMLALFFLISFIYNLLRCMKVTVVVTAAGSGAEVIPFLKVWAVLPAAVFITYLYTKLSNYLNREQVFYTMIAFFLGFFTLFLLVLHPNREYLELVTISDFLQSKLPEGLKGFISVIRHWPLSLFYVLAEMWSAIVLSMLFWGFANEVSTVDEAKRFYAIFALGANFSGIFSGQSAQFLTVTKYNPNLPFGNNAWEQTLAFQLGAVLLVGIAVVFLFRWVNKRVIKENQNPRYMNAFSHLEESKKQTNPMNINSTTSNTTNPNSYEESKKLSLGECFSYLLKSSYMIYIAILVVAYNIVYNLSDVMWTHQVSLHFTEEGIINAAKINAYINQIASVTGIFATLSGLILSGNVIRRYGWTITAVITPLIWMITSIGFFACMLYEANPAFTNTMYALTHIPITTLILLFGSAQICLGRASKYTLFDETKEIAFIPLPKEEQRKGKAVVDGIASRFGKSGGSLTIQVLLVLCGNLAMTTPFIAGIFLIVISFWLIAVRNLGKRVARYIDDPTQVKKKQNVNTSLREEITPV